MADYALLRGLHEGLGADFPKDLYWLIIDYGLDLETRRKQVIRGIDLFARHIQRYHAGQEKNLIKITARASSWPETETLPRFVRLSCLSLGVGERYTHLGVCTRHKKKDYLCDKSCRNGRNLIRKYRPGE